MSSEYQQLKAHLRKLSDELDSGHEDEPTPAKIEALKKAIAQKETLLEIRKSAQAA